MIGAFRLLFYVPSSVVRLTVFRIVDTLSWVMIVLTFVICGFSVLASKKVFMSGLSSNRYLFLMVSIVLTLVMAFSSPRMIGLYWWFEASLIPMVFLIVG